MSQEDDTKADGDELSRWERRTQSTIDFILQQQAQYSAGMQRMQEAWAEADKKWEQRWERTERMWGRTEESVRALLTIVQSHEGDIATLKEAQAQTDKQMKETDERINALVNAVEALIIERRNGGRRAGEGDGGGGGRP